MNKVKRIVENIADKEVVDIVAWVFLWEAVDIKCFRMREMSLKRKRYAAFIDMKIDFIDVP